MAYRLNQTISSGDLAHIIGGEHKGRHINISSVAPVSTITEGALTFGKKKNFNSDNCATNDFAFIVDADVENDCIAQIIIANPRLGFINALQFLNAEIGFISKASSEIHPSVLIGKNVVIEEGVSIGPNSVIGDNVVIKRGTEIGSHVVIRTAAIIGDEGFGFEFDGSQYIRFPHLGGVKIHDYVEIGPNSNVQRGTLGDTVIHRGVKIDAFVHVGHNSITKEHAIITACTEISGGVIIGKNTWIGPNVSIMQKIEIGDYSVIGIGSVVLKSIPEKCVFVGNPARLVRKIAEENLSNSPLDR